MLSYTQLERTDCGYIASLADMFQKRVSTVHLADMFQKRVSTVHYRTKTIFEFFFLFRVWMEDQEPQDTQDPAAPR